MADDIETIRKVGLQRAYALIRDLEAYRGFAPLTPEQRALWEERAEVRAQAFCDGLAADLALMTASTRVVKSGRRGAQLASIAMVSAVTAPEARDPRPRLRAA